MTGQGKRKEMTRKNWVVSALTGATGALFFALSPVAHADPAPPPPAPSGGATDGSLVINEAPGDYEDSGSGVGDIYIIPIL